MSIKTANPTIKRFLQTLLQPVGSTMYVWGGGWNEADDGAGKSATTIGISPAWKKFTEKQNADYDWEKTRYQIEDGLDCSGFVGWGLYNTLNTMSGGTGYVRKAKEIAKNLAERGFGQYTDREKVCDYRPGDVMSSACTDCGHVWVVVGECDDGSVVVLHETPPGVMLEGTVTPEGKKESEAVRLARTYMERYYPKWQKTYPIRCKDIRFLTHYGQFRWNVTGESVMTDPDGYAEKSAEEVLKDLFGE